MWAEPSEQLTPTHSYWYKFCCFTCGVVVDYIQDREQGRIMIAILLIVLHMFISSSCGMSNNYSVTRLLRNLDTLQVKDLQNGCGRLKNRLIIFSDESKACCKYDESVAQQRGELYAYHLSQILFNGGNSNTTVPPTAVITLDLNSPLWSSVIDQARDAGWRNGKLILISLFIENMYEEYFPASAIKQFFSPQTTIKSSDQQKAKTAMQQLPDSWSDLIVFDYISSNSDRLYCSLVNSQWSSTITNKPIHNLGKTSTGSLVLFDNESCFTIGKHYYSKILQSHFMDNLCDYNQLTITILQQHVNGTRNLLMETQKRLLLFNKVGFQHVKQLSRHSHDEFMERTKSVITQFNKCQM